MSTTQLISLRILTPEGEIFKKENLTAVRVPLADGGYIGIRPGHAPLIGETTKGHILFRTEMDQERIELLPGVIDIRDNTVIILTAGEVKQAPHLSTEPAENEFDRLMQTLVRTLTPENDSDLEQK